MPLATGELKRRIKGIRNTRKITKAMELVAASKMRKAVTAALATRAYALRARELLLNLRHVTDAQLHPLLDHRNVRSALLILYTPDRGLAGALNTQIVRVALEEVRKANGRIDVMTVGKKGQEAIRRAGGNIIATFPNPARQPLLADVLPIARLALTQFTEKTYDRVLLVWADYQSAISHKPQSRTILPLERREIEKTIGEIAAIEHQEKLPDAPLLEYLFEPSADVVLEAMLPRLVEMQLYQALLEATASEHASRMIAMKNASDAAGDLLDDLILDYNQARQSAITKDLAEISASRAVLE